MPRLILNREGVDLVMHEVVRDIVMIGRAPSNHIVIDHPAVSAQHAILARVADDYLFSVNAASRPVLITPSDVSGHYPVTCDFTIRGENE
jgi:hypothetical protein